MHMQAISQLGEISCCTAGLGGANWRQQKAAILTICCMICAVRKRTMVYVVMHTPAGDSNHSRVWLVKRHTWPFCGHGNGGGAHVACENRAAVPLWYRDGCAKRMHTSSRRKPGAKVMFDSYGGTVQHINLTWMLVHISNWYFHWSTDTPLVHRHRQLFLMRAAADTPTCSGQCRQGNRSFTTRCDCKHRQVFVMRVAANTPTCKKTVSRISM